MWNLLGMQMMEIQLQEMLHPAATERLARERGVPSGRWLSGPRCQWLSGWGRFLVVLGQQLQRAGLPPAAVMEERVTTERRFGA